MSALIAALFTTSCSDDESWVPPYLTDFADLATDTDGAIVSMTLDNGTKYDGSTFKCSIGNDQSLSKDSLYRAICVYTVVNATATLYSYTMVFAPEPITTEQLADDVMKTDPCTIQGIWRGGDYINARMLVQGKDKAHIVAFIDEGIVDNTLTLRLYHDQNGDMEAFTRTIYLSCPLRGYAGQLVKGRDSIAFVVNQQDKGLTTYKLPY
ncbi:MAG: hypothetical protein J5593_02420 [Bacteroidaceae bacterium]|nr:hypothetical protein [Bacteroidaceae bacterium]